MQLRSRIIQWTLALALAPATLAAQEAATVTGRVTSGQGQPEASVLVRIESLSAGATTGADGSYRLVIPGARLRVGQSVQITASRQDLTTVTRTITLSPGASLTQNFQVSAQPIILPDLVITGTPGAVEARKVPFSVGTVDAAQIPVPPANAASAIQGRVAGANVVSGSGRPGAAPSILLRGPKSINAQGRDQEPLYIVDGVILSSGAVDIDALDIEEIEILKGAAAASMYGSRAGNGVIQISTRRGTSVPDDQVRYSVRSEYGRSGLPATPEDLLTETHHYALTAEGRFMTRQGVACDFVQCSNVQLAGQRAATRAGANEWNTYQNVRWPGQTYDQVDRFFTDGAFTQNHFAAEGRAGATNFHVSFSNLRDQGIMPGRDGLERNNFRVNVDQAIRSNLSVSASAFYSRSTSDQFPENSGNPMFALTRMPAGVNLYSCLSDPAKECLDNPDDLLLRADPNNTESENPIYEVMVRQFNSSRGRFLGSANFRYSPVNWFDVDANASYDRLDRSDRDYHPKGFRTVTSQPARNEGQLRALEFLTEGFNGSLTGTFRFDLSDNIHNRTQLRYLYEQNDVRNSATAGFNLQVADVPILDNLDPTTLAATSSFTSERADGYFAITNFDIADRYVIDALIRNDGSSLFGADQRRQWYYRLAGAWLISDEAWFRLPGVDDLKLRYSLGTAGGRPSFRAQYETFSFSGGSISPLTLGNKDLRPEYTVEHEAGIELGALDNRATLSLTYARSTTDDQILSVPLPSFAGYVTRTVNAGTLESDTWEASLDARLVQRDNFSWSARVNYDRTRSTITSLDVPEFVYGVTGQNLTNVFYARAGERLGTFYGMQFATSCDQLPNGVDCGQFAVNDDGYLVYTGGADLAAGRWGDFAPAAVQAGGAHLAGLRWGVPFAGLCRDRVSDEQTLYCPLGKTLPDYSLGVSSTVSWGGLSLYGLIDAVQGFSVYNQPLQWAVFRRTAGLLDQTGKSEDLQKPLGYYDQLYGASGLAPSSAFVEDGSFVKLRELSLRYTFGEAIRGRIPGVRGLDGLSVQLSGRNLHTWTDYRGYDPEVGKNTGDTGSSALGRVEGFQYPNFRTWTLGVEVNF
ncbi:MAG TPA: SusC/RagA family TonB-linked outer membrane protein [Longimicrobium sp.]|nr:SusC/RagA family TonB-linked outer membrane protein [Longimicrobium sp.]